MSNENKQFFKTLAFLALPIILQDLVNAAVNMLDTFMIGRIGLQELTAVGLANQVFFLFILLVFGITSGSSIYMGQFWGKNDVVNIHKTMGICIVSSLAAAFIFSAAAFFIPEIIMNIYSKDDPMVIVYGAEYLRIIWVSYFLIAIIASVNASLRSCGQTRLPMSTSILALCCNALFNYIFIFIFHMSVRGAAIATVIARAIELAVQLILVYKLKMPVAGKLKAYFSANLAFVKGFYIITLPVILNEFVWALGTSLYNVAYKYTGTEGQGAVQIANNIQQLFMVLGLGVGSACGIMLSNALGAGEREKAIRYSRKCLLMSVLLSVCMGILLVIFSPTIVNIFNVPSSVKALAQRILRVIAIGMVFKTFNYTTIVGILRSGGDTLYCLILDGGAVWLVGVPFSFFTARYLGLPVYWVVAAAYCEEFFKFALSAHRTFSNKWAKSIV